MWGLLASARRCCLGRLPAGLFPVETHFPAVDVESGHNFDILRLIRPNLPVHQPNIGAR